MNYETANILFTVKNDTTIRIVMVLTLMDGWIMKILDLKGAFLYGKLYEGETKIYMVVPEVFEGIYGINVVLMLPRKIIEESSKGILERDVDIIWCDGLQKNTYRPMHAFKVDINGTVGMVGMDLWLWIFSKEMMK